MDPHWSALGEVALVSVGATVGVVFVFALGVRALAARQDGQAALPVAVAGLCFLACAVAVLYGLYLIVPQFH
jgi:hypothetical protein